MRKEKKKTASLQWEKDIYYYFLNNHEKLFYLYKNKTTINQLIACTGRTIPSTRQ